MPVGSEDSELLAFRIEVEKLETGVSTVQYSYYLNIE